MIPTRQTGSNFNQSTPEKAILPMRIIWAALLMGQIFFMGILTFILKQNGQPQPAPQPVLSIIGLVMLVTVVPGAFAVRHMLLQRARANGVVPPQTYATANIIFWAGCEGVSFFNLITIVITHSFRPAILIVAAAIACQIVAFPRLSAMKPPSGTFQIN